MKFLISITGPTAIGKTALSIKLAQHFGCEIVSCDSRQFYKEMSIGTAVPNQTELESAVHHFIQNKSINEHYSVGDFEKDAIYLLEDLFKKNPIAILVGGSGLYVDAIANGLDHFPEVNMDIRNELVASFSSKGIEYLVEEFKKVDPNYYNFLLKNNPQTLQNPHRLMRFIEVSKSSEKPYSTYLDKEKTKRNFKIISIGLSAERAIMYERINKRVELMIANGLIEEAKSLISYKDHNALQTVGYKELFDYFNQKTTLDQAIEEIKKNTRRFAKRQITWFKRNPETKWFDYLENEKNIINYIENTINTNTCQ